MRQPVVVAILRLGALCPNTFNHVFDLAGLMIRKSWDECLELALSCLVDTRFQDLRFI